MLENIGGMQTERVAVIIVAGGSGSRMGAQVPKQFLLLAGRPVLVRTVERIASALPGSEIVIVLPAEHIGYWQNLCAEYALTVPHEVCAGGENRFASVKRGLSQIADTELIAVHDGVRALASPQMIEKGIATAKAYGSAVPVVRPFDSFRMIEGGKSHAVDRDSLCAVQTPQIFSAELLRRAYKQPYDETFTDDASVVEKLGVDVALFAGEHQNMKITTPLDMRIAEVIISESI